MTISQLVFLVGSFGESPWILQEVGRETFTQGLKLSCPDTHAYVLPPYSYTSVRSIYVCGSNKTVAVGAVLYYLDHYAVGQSVRYTYGTLGSIQYDPSNLEHRKRPDKKYLGMTGEFQLDVFSPIVLRVTVSAFGSHAQN